MKYFAILIISIFLSGCCFQIGKSGTNSIDKKQTITFVTWNTQTFFDGVTEGCEYSEFQKEKNWNNSKYLVRLERLCNVMEALDADVFVLQEIENDAVMRDISNMMAGNSWNRSKLWSYCTFVKKKNDSIGCGVFSKYPIDNVKSHCLDIRTENIHQPSMRPIIEVSINVNERKLPVFVNHWKSKSGGAEVTDVWRKWQEKVLVHCINNSLKHNDFCIAAGDFNKDIKEFSCCENENNYNKNVTLNGEKNIQAFSPWLKNGNFTTEIGSYFYKEKWERIDHIFTIGNIEITDFAPQAEEPWINEYGTPIKYQFYTGQGYSDHLPLKCTLNF